MEFSNKDQCSYTKYCEKIKGLFKPEQTYDEMFLEKRADEKTKAKFERFFNWCDTNGIKHPKVKYPVMFG